MSELLPLLLTLMPIAVTGITVGVAMTRRRGNVRRLEAMAQELGLRLETRKRASYPDLVGYLDGHPVRVQLGDDAGGGMDVRIAMSGAPEVRGVPLDGSVPRPPDVVPTGDLELDRAFALSGGRAEVLALASPSVRRSLRTTKLALGSKTVRWHYGRMKQLDGTKMRALLEWLQRFVDALGAEADLTERLAERATDDPLAEVRVQALAALCDTGEPARAAAVAEDRLSDGTAAEAVVAAAHLQRWPKLRALVEDPELDLKMRVWGLGRLAPAPGSEEVLAAWLADDALFANAVPLAASWRGDAPVEVLAEQALVRLDPASIPARRLFDNLDVRCEQINRVLEGLARGGPHARADELLLATARCGDEKLSAAALAQLARQGRPPSLVALDALREQLPRRRRRELEAAVLAIQERHGLAGEIGGISLVDDGDAGALSLSAERRAEGRRVEQ